MSVERIVLVDGDGEHTLTPFPAYAEAQIRCRHCGAEPVRVQGDGAYPGDDDRHYAAHGYCAECRGQVGTIKAYVSTIFGVREDIAVLHGRPRVY